MAISSPWVIQCRNRLYHKSFPKWVGLLLRCTPLRHNGRYTGYNVKLLVEYFVSPKKALFDFVSVKSSCKSIAG